MEYKQKYLKYKLKYLLLKQQEEYVFTGGMEGIQEIFDRVERENALEDELEEYTDVYEFIEKYKNKEFAIELGEALSLNLYTPPRTTIDESRETPGAPKGERPKEILDIIYHRLEETFELKDTIDTIEELKKGVLNEATFEKLFDAIFQLSDTDDEQIMILNLVLFIKDLEHDYNNYLKESKPAKGDKIIILIEKCIKKLNEKIQLENYSFNIEMLNDEMLRQGTDSKRKINNANICFIIITWNFRERFSFQKPRTRIRLYKYITGSRI